MGAGHVGPGHSRTQSGELRRWLASGADAVRRERQRLDAINVFPIADSDTGTNLYLTLREGNRAVAALAESATHREVVAAFAHGCLMGARGNSGVIISQYLAAFLGTVDRGGGLASATAPVIADALDAASDAAYEAVGEPVEGTILTVARCAAEAARAAVELGAGREAVAIAAVLDARAALARTTDALPAAKAAGVVDAGAAGLLLQLEALAETIAGPAALEAMDAVDWEIHERSGSLTPAAQAAAHEYAPGGGAYEVMFVARADRVGGTTESLSLTRALMQVGDSVAVTGAGGLWQAHVHTDFPELAIDLAREAASTQIVVRDVSAPPGEAAFGFVALTTCPGLAAPLAGAGAAVLISLDPDGATPSDLDRVIADARAERVVVAAGTECLASVARIVAADLEPHVTVLDATGEPHLIAAFVASALAAPGEDPFDVMAAAVARCGAVGTTVDALATEAARIVPPEAEIVTIILGAGLSTEVADEAVRILAERAPQADINVFLGGQAEPEVILGYETAPAP